VVILSDKLINYNTRVLTEPVTAKILSCQFYSNRTIDERNENSHACHSLPNSNKRQSDYTTRPTVNIDTSPTKLDLSISATNYIAFCVITHLKTSVLSNSTERPRSESSLAYDTVITVQNRAVVVSTTHV